VLGSWVVGEMAPKQQMPESLDLSGYGRGLLPQTVRLRKQTTETPGRLLASRIHTHRAQKSKNPDYYSHVRETTI
jgi:hypothetical protein